MDSPKDISNRLIASVISFVRMTCYFFFNTFLSRCNFLGVYWRRIFICKVHRNLLMKIILLVFLFVFVNFLVVCIFWYFWQILLNLGERKDSLKIKLLIHRKRSHHPFANMFIDHHAKQGLHSPNNEPFACIIKHCMLPSHAGLITHLPTCS
jgi:hypothetical protein